MGFIIICKFQGGWAFCSLMNLTFTKERKRKGRRKPPAAAGDPSPLWKNQEKKRERQRKQRPLTSQTNTMELHALDRVFPLLFFYFASLCMIYTVQLVKFFASSCTTYTVQLIKFNISPKLTFHFML